MDPWEAWDDTGVHNDVPHVPDVTPDTPDRYLVVIAATKTEYVATQLKEALAFFCEGHRWDPTRHGPGVNVLGAEVAVTHTDGSWQVIRALNPLRGVSDMYLLELYWDNTKEPETGTLSVGIVSSAVDASRTFELGATTDSYGIAVAPRIIRSGPGSSLRLPPSPLTSISPGDTIGIMLANGRLLLLLRPAGEETVRHAVDIACGVPMTTQWHVAVGMRGVAGAGIRVSMLPSAPYTSIVQCAAVPAASLVASPAHEVALVHQQRAVAIPIGAPSRWRSLHTTTQMSLGFGGSHEYYFELGLPVVQNKHIMLGVLPVAGHALPLPTEWVGCRPRTGWAYYLHDHTLRLEGNIVGVSGPGRALGPVGPGATLCMLVDMNLSSPAGNSISWGLRSRAGGEVQWWGPLVDHVFVDGVTYSPVLSLHDSGDVVEFNRPARAPALPRDDHPSRADEGPTVVVPPTVRGVGDDPTEHSQLRSRTRRGVEKVGSGWVTFQAARPMTLGFANANVYYYELDLVTCANGLVMVGVVAEALNGVALGKVGEHLGMRGTDGVSFEVQTHQRRVGDHVGPVDPDVRLVAPFSAKTLCLLVNMNSLSPADSNSILLGFKDGSPFAPVTWLPTPLWEACFQEDVPYILLVSLHDDGDVITLRTPQVPDDLVPRVYNFE